MEVVLHESTNAVCDARCDSLNQKKPIGPLANQEKFDEKGLGSRLFVTQQKIPIDIRFENVTFTASCKTKNGKLPSFMGKTGKS